MPPTLSPCQAPGTAFAQTIKRRVLCQCHQFHRTNGKESTTGLCLEHFSFRSKPKGKAIFTRGAHRLFSQRSLFVFVAKTLFVPTLPLPQHPPAIAIALAIIIIMGLSIMKSARSQRRASPSLWT